MKKIIIVSDDNCAVKQIINNIKKTKNKIITQKYNNQEFKFKLYNNQLKEKNIIYFIDIYPIQDQYLDIIKKLREEDQFSHIIIISMSQNIEPLLRSRLYITDYLNKIHDFDKKIKQILTYLLKEEPPLKNKIKISNNTIPIIINKDEIENIYHYPNDQISIQYKNGKNNILLSINQTTIPLQEMIKDNFYLDKQTIKFPKKKQSKRNYYSEPFKQLLVDLHLIFKIDSATLAKHFQVDTKYIKNWSKLSKYTRKINFIELIIGKLIIKSYFKK